VADRDYEYEIKIHLNLVSGIYMKTFAVVEVEGEVS
jgi:hypothetical protein